MNMSRREEFLLLHNRGQNPATPWAMWERGLHASIGHIPMELIKRIDPFKLWAHNHWSFPLYDIIFNNVTRPNLSIYIAL